MIPLHLTLGLVHQSRDICQHVFNPVLKFSHHTVQAFRRRDLVGDVTDIDRNRNDFIGVVLWHPVTLPHLDAVWL
jgi:hypothetical protein